jgi:hypothetical protein
MEAPESGKYTIKQVFTREDGKVNKAVFKNGGHEVQAYISQSFVSAEVKEGVEAECVFEVKKWDNGGESLAVKQWGEPKAKGGYSGGGGSKWQPKPEHENLSIMAQTALGRAVEAHAPSAMGKELKPEAIVETMHLFFAAMLEDVKKAKGSLS